MRQIDTLDHIATHPGVRPADLGRALGGNARAAQRILARAREAGLVEATGDRTDRAYRLTPAGRAMVQRPATSSGATVDTLRRVSAALAEAGIPVVEDGRTVPIEERVRRLIDERDAADTSIDDDLRRRAAVVFETPAVRATARALLGRAPGPDDALRVLVEVGLAALQP